MPLRASPSTLHNKLPLARLKVDQQRCTVSIGYVLYTLDRKELIPTLTADCRGSVVEVVVGVIYVCKYLLY